MFDEAQILTEKALEDMVAATNQSRFPAGALVLHGHPTATLSDPSEAFKLRRREALSGETEDAVYIECSADEDAEPDDREQWRLLTRRTRIGRRCGRCCVCGRTCRRMSRGSVKRWGFGTATSRVRGLITDDEWRATGVSLRRLTVSVRSASRSRSMVRGYQLLVPRSMLAAFTSSWWMRSRGRWSSGIASLADWLAERWRKTALIAIRVGLERMRLRRRYGNAASTSVQSMWCRRLSISRRRRCSTTR